MDSDVKKKIPSRLTDIPAIATSKKINCNAIDFVVKKGVIRYNDYELRSVRIPLINKSKLRKIKRGFSIVLQNNTFHFDPYTDLSVFLNLARREFILSKYESEYIGICKKFLGDYLWVTVPYKSCIISDGSIVFSRNDASFELAKKLNIKSYIERIQSRDKAYCNQIIGFEDMFRDLYEEMYQAHFSYINQEKEFKIFTGISKFNLERLIEGRTIRFKYKMIAASIDDVYDEYMYGFNHIESDDRCVDLYYLICYYNKYFLPGEPFVFEESTLNKVKELISQIPRGRDNTYDYYIKNIKKAIDVYCTYSIHKEGRKLFRVSEYYKKGHLKYIDRHLKDNVIDILYFNENYSHFSDEYTSSKSRSYFLIYKSAIFLVPTDCRYADYLFRVERGKEELALFYLWAYYSSDLCNKREYGFSVNEYALKMGIKEYMRI